MKKYKIAWLAGDGIGAELSVLAKKVLNVLQLGVEYVNADIGWEFWKKEGNPLPSRTIKILNETDCGFLVSITSKSNDDAQLELNNELKNLNLKYISPIVQLRKKFQLHTNIRPCFSFSGNINNLKENIDLVIFRENTEGMYSGVEFKPVSQELYTVLKKYNKNMDHFDQFNLNDLAISTRIMSKNRCKSIVNEAFQYAKKNNINNVSLVDKPNVLRETGQLMIDCAKEVSKSYSGIKLNLFNIDAMCMQLVKNPNKFSVIVAENMFGDILSDLAAQLVGGLGFAPSANIGNDYAIFEPCHGSAPKYTGLDKVNPIATFLSLKMMLDWLDEKEKSNLLLESIKTVVLERKFGTYDMALNNKSSELTLEICRHIKRLS